MAKGDISWKRRTEAGDRLEIYARQSGENWTFYSRGGRNQQWQILLEPPLEDWLELLDAVQRRIERQFMKEEAAYKLSKLIQERFPKET